MLTLTITITGNTIADLEMGIQEVKDCIAQGLTSTHDSTDNGTTQFEIEGEAEPDEGIGQTELELR